MEQNTEEIEHIDYSLKENIISLKMIIAILVIFFVTLFSYINFTFINSDMIQQRLATAVPNCKLNVGELKFDFFLPKVKIDQVTIPGNCAKLPEDIKIKDIVLNFRLISFSPFGLSFLGELSILNQKIEAKIVPSFSSVSLYIENKGSSSINKISLSEISPLIPMLKFTGDLFLSTVYANIGYNGAIKDLTLNIASKNLKLPTQKVQGFTTPNINFEKFLLQADTVSENELHLKNFIIGEEKSPLIAQMVGKINLNKRSFALSKINLDAEVKVSEKILEEIFIIKPLLEQFDSKNKFYQIPIKGTISRPRIIK